MKSEMPADEKTPDENKLRGKDLPDERYQQLGLFSIIVAELTVVPGALAGLAYYLTHPNTHLGISWKLWTGLGGVLGFVIGMVRVVQLTRAAERKSNRP
jgi:hypothetical protein